MRYIVLALLLTACGTEETTTETTVVAPEVAKKPTTKPSEPAETATKTPTETTTTTKPITYTVKFKYLEGSERVGAVSCEVSREFLLEWPAFGTTTSEAKFKAQADKPECETTSSTSLTCTITDNYTEATAECGSLDPVTGGRSGRKAYKVYSKPDLTEWNIP
jgi:hypothetical protein